MAYLLGGEFGLDEYVVRPDNHCHQFLNLRTINNNPKGYLSWSGFGFAPQWSPVRVLSGPLEVLSGR